jgi:hypothetical protein
MATSFDEVKKYYEDRFNELKKMSENKAVPGIWVFVCASTFIEYLSRLVQDYQTGQERKNYTYFVKTFFEAKYRDCSQFTPPVVINSRNGNPLSLNNDEIIPAMMYVVLRCGLVHQFSIHSNSLPSNFEERIALGEESNNIPCGHFGFATSQTKNVLVLTKEGLIKDIGYALNEVFKTGSTVPQGDVIRRYEDLKMVTEVKTNISQIPLTNANKCKQLSDLISEDSSLTTVPIQKSIGALSGTQGESLTLTPSNDYWQP